MSGVLQSKIQNSYDSFELINLMNSSLVATFSNAPVKSEVVVTEFCFSIPLIHMHICFASITTATPNGESVFCMHSLIWRVNLSCTCNRRE